ncbi:phytoene desaturase family protein [Aspergillus thermomutatus]|uniref:Phytoene desaturase n=1 Tax=Aspergillus thermomutatus TaxID=41047 RepID=A0A397HU57_ASPTH|nr:uncharacterized protein CDV56_108053 [Aspergillus thermomutatus]RHZ66741.1 hypothetical protein CDV56_108053 [Aspergillus thermomutatus]
MPPSVIVIGAGAGGITTAAHLAKHGFKVTVVEKCSDVGGRCSLIYNNGYRFDQGPSLLLMPEVFIKTFHDLGTCLEAEGVNLLKCAPNYRIWFSDGDSFQQSTDLAQMKSEIERYEGKEGFLRFLAFMQEAGRHYESSLTHVLRKNFPGFASMLRPELLAAFLRMHPFESIWARVSRYFESDKLRRVFTFASMYLGMNPFEAPGTYSLLQYSEVADGIWYPEGGFQKVLAALATVGKRLGVDYRLNSPVDKVLLSERQDRVTGVRLASGEELHADIVVVNADLIYAYNNLLPQTSYARSLQKRPASCSSISFFWSFDRIIPELQQHNIFLADEYQESFDAIFKRQELPKDPSFYVNVPSRLDPTAAPEGKDSVIVLVPIGHLTQGPASALSTSPENLDALVHRARECVFATIEARTGAKNLRERLVHEYVETPLTWKSKFNLDRGAILGLSHSFFNVLSFRPKTKHVDIHGLYFVGASTHPGTGVPVCLSGGKVVSDQIVGEWAEGKRSRLLSHLESILFLLMPLLLCGGLYLMQLSS